MTIRSFQLSYEHGTISSHENIELLALIEKGITSSHDNIELSALMIIWSYQLSLK